MIELDPISYKLLKKLKKINDYVVPDSNSGYAILDKYNLISDDPIKVSPNETIFMRKINERGKSYVSEHKKKTFQKWIFFTLPLVVAMIAVLIAILK